MGKPTFDNGIPRSCISETGPRGFGLPLSKEGVRSLNKIGGFKQTRGTETSQYPEERTSTETPLVVASEQGLGQCLREIKPNDLERSAIAGDSPVGVKQRRTRVGRDT